MAIRPFNSIEGYSVGQDPQITVIDANGNVTATNLTVDGVSNLGPVGNVHITGGSTGQALVTDGNGNLSFQDFTSNNAAPMPYYIPNNESYIIRNNFQGLFAQAIDVEGVLEVDGTLIDVSSYIQYPNNHVLFSQANYAAGNAGFTFDSVSGNFAVPGNGTCNGNLLPNGNIIYNLGSPTQRWNDLYLSNNTIYLGESTISATTGNITLISSGGASLEVTGNAQVSTLQNGNSNIAVAANGNVSISVSGTSNVLIVKSNGIAVTGNTTVANLTVTGTLNAGDITVSGIANGTSNIDIVGVSGNVTTSVNGVANVTVVSTTGMNVEGTLSATYLSGDGQYLSNINGANISGNISGNITNANYASYAGNVVTAAQPNITSVGTLSSLTVSGNITSGNVTGANLISANYISGTLKTNAQPNITSVGTLSSLAVTANVSAGGVLTDNLYYANGNPWDLQLPAGSNTEIQFNDNGSFGASANLTFDSVQALLTLNGNLAVGNISNATVISSDYLISENGCVTVGNGIISVSGNTAGIFNSSIDTLNIGLGATSITIGSPSGNVTIRGNVIASNVVSSGLVNAENITVGDLYSKRTPVSLIAPNTVIDQFLPTEYRSAKYTIKASNDAGYQALEVLLVHDSINSIMTVYGSLSTTGNDIVTLSTVLDSGYVKLLATGVAANTVVNLMGTYVPD